ncbi:phage portal protein [Maritimibacter sp. 55A14]|uniref:phage portal protein n=1 Tax=Maritimibacter sp. 55A14 TaxID=2174844 RepID=UPI000D61ED7A|nr:phage portal protein [Maritimibacter sp. 55A14]PWE32771.1 phage portal protein [Maritimibacter sp. 55A14]
MKQSYPRLRAGSVRMKPRASGFGGTPYQAGSSTGETMLNFHPPFRPSDGEVLPDRDKIVARARDLTRNNGWAAGGVAKEVDSVIGANFRPLMKPDWKALGLDSAWAAEFKLAVEARWRSYADDPRKLADITRSQTVSQMFGMAYRNYLMEGDAVGLVAWKENRPTHTCLRIVDPDLLSNPGDQPDGEKLRGGVEKDADGAARAYHFRQAHKAAIYASAASFTWKRVMRERAWGRPNVLHFFDKTRDGQSRGVSRLAPVIEKLRMEDHYARVELQAAVINAVLAAFIKSPLGPETMDDLFGEGEGTPLHDYQIDRAQYYKDRDGVTLGGARVTQLYPNDEIGVVPTARPAAQFGDFESAVLRNIAAGLGQSYEQLAADWSKTNYSSARAALIEVWRGWTSRRIAFAQGFCQPYLMAWLEEQVMDGHVPLPRGAPDFHAHWPAYARAKWIGPGKGFVDPVKEAQAAAMRVSLGLSTLEEEAAELTGSDHMENMEQVEREIAAMPEGVLHPSQESFAKLIGPGGATATDFENGNR